MSDIFVLFFVIGKFFIFFEVVIYSGCFFFFFNRVDFEVSYFLEIEFFILFCLILNIVGVLFKNREYMVLFICVIENLS